MAKNIIFIGLDVDDKSFHGCGYDKNNGILQEFACRPNIGHLVKKLKQIEEKGFEIKVCYEATYLGYTLCRGLREKGYWCDVIAPSLIPKQPGKRQKTNRIDCRKLAEYYANRQLTTVTVPEEANERVRDLVRSRNFIRRQLKDVKLHILSQCRRCGINYKQEVEGQGNYWTKRHKEWLRGSIGRQEDVNLQMNFNLLLVQMEGLEGLVKSYDEKIDLISREPEYKEKVDALCCYRGINRLSAMTIIPEIGDARRFSHPRQLTGFSGLDLCEYSTGEKEIRFGITKLGNRHIRTSVIEACQTASKFPRISRRLKQHRQSVDQKYVEIADRCMKRLYQKSSRLLRREKEKNKVKVACAREMLCFIWESLQAAT